MQVDHAVYEHDDSGQWRVRWTGADDHRRAAKGFQTRAEAEAHVAGSVLTATDTLVYRAMDQDVPLGLYTTARAAQAHAEHHARHLDSDLIKWLAEQADIPNVDDLTVTAWTWERPETSGPSNDEPISLYATVAGEEYGTGYTVLPLTLAVAYDPKAEG